MQKRGPSLTVLSFDRSLRSNGGFGGAAAGHEPHEHGHSGADKGTPAPAAQPHQQDHQNQHGQDELEVDLEPGGHPQAGALVGFRQILVKAPAPLRDAEQKVDQRTNRQQQVRDDEVLAVQNIARADDVDIRPDIVAKHAGQAQEGQQHAVDEHGLLAADAEGVHADGQNVLKHRQHRGEAGEHHEQEEQRAPEAAAGHVHEQRRQGLKDQRGAFTGRNAEGEAGRENDGARHEGHEGIQNTDPHGLAGQGHGVHSVEIALHQLGAEIDQVADGQIGADIGRK